MTTTEHELTKEMVCIRCGARSQAILVRTITASATSQVYWKCKHCGKNAGGPGKYIQHEKITNYGMRINSIPIEKDYRTNNCAVCGVLGAEYHHFAPRFIFREDADLWPTAYLCKEHHDEWHKRVTPEMTKGAAWAQSR